MANILENPTSPLPTEGSEIELIFLGTGTSSSVPDIGCITTPPSGRKCRTCLSTLTPEGKKNIRRNTSAVLRMNDRNGHKVTIVIDVGKNFQAAAVEWFPKYGLRTIDAVLITHAHADAVNGLDDLRAWTLRSSIQSHIDVYLTKETFTAVKRAFPYLVLRDSVAGGGDLPEFHWHFINHETPFDVGETGVQVTPLIFHHGRLFTTKRVVESKPLCDSTTPSMATANATEQMFALESTSVMTYDGPYICLGFKLQDALVYASDVSHIPQDTWAVLDSSPIKVFVLDCLRLSAHASHMGLSESMAAARRLRASRTYFTGFNHEISHDEHITIGRFVGGEIDDDMSGLTATERTGVSLVGEGSRIWVRPAHDGLRVLIGSDVDGTVKDDSYD